MTTYNLERFDEGFDGSLDGLLAATWSYSNTADLVHEALRRWERQERRRKDEHEEFADANEQLVEFLGFWHRSVVRSEGSGKVLGPVIMPHSFESIGEDINE